MPTTSSEGAAPRRGGGPVAPAVFRRKPVNVLPVDYASGHRATRFRWVVLGLVFFAITINYIDRKVMGLLAPELRKQFGIDARAYGYVTGASRSATRFGPGDRAGGWLDWVGTRLGYAIALASWSIASMLHAFAGSALGFGIMRGLLGVTESPAYPAANKTLAEWFPKKERALAMGFANAGANVGSILAPAHGRLLVRQPRLAVGVHRHRRRRAALAACSGSRCTAGRRSTRASPPTSWPTSTATRPSPRARSGGPGCSPSAQTWGFALGKFFTDPIWSFYLFWLPTFFKDASARPSARSACRMVVIYVMADVGSIAGGWLSSALIKRGWSLTSRASWRCSSARSLVVPAAFVSDRRRTCGRRCCIDRAWRCRRTRGSRSNLYTLVSDTFPQRAVGSVAGLGGTFGYLGTTRLHAPGRAGSLYATGNNYLPIFIACGSAYLLAFLIIHWLMPKLEPAPIDDSGARRVSRSRPGTVSYDVKPLKAPRLAGIGAAACLPPPSRRRASGHRCAGRC